MEKEKKNHLSRREAAVRLCAVSMVLYTVWLLIPAFQTTGRAVTGCAAAALFALGVLLDRDYFRARWALLIGQALCAACAPLVLYFFLNRGGTGFAGFYVQNAMLWFPLIYLSYSREKNDSRLWRYWKWALLGAMVLTTLTTIGWLIEGMLRGGRIYAYSRSLGYAEPGREAYLKELMLRNIGGYDFVYATVVSLPFTCVGISENRGWKRVGFTAFLLAQTVMVLLSQYTYAMVFTAAILAVELLALLLRKLTKLKTGPSLLWALVPLALVFLFRVPLVNAAASFCDAKGLTSVSHSLHQLLTALEGGALEGENRLSHYRVAWEGFRASPLVGSLPGGAKRLSQHSEVLDLLSGLGMLGTAAFLSMQALMLRGGLRGLRHNACRAQVWAAGCAFLAVAALGTVFYSRDIFLVLAGGLAGILSSENPKII